MRILTALAFISACTRTPPETPPRPITPVDPDPPPELAFAEDAGAEGPCPATLDPAKPATLYTILFDSNSASLKAVSCCVLDGIAKRLSVHPEWMSVGIEVHSDERGNDAYNLKLSQDRADMIRAALVGLGADAARLLTQGFGESCPLDPAHTPDAWAKNRRVVIAVATTTSIALSCSATRAVPTTTPKVVAVRVCTDPK